MIYDDDLYQALLLRYPRDEYVFLQEVSMIDGARRADAIAIALWASRGQEMHGFEVKASRADWLLELRQPAKAETIFSLCDRFWLVTNGEDIVRDGELPSTWGWLDLRGKALRTNVKAPKLTPSERPWSFICRLLRKCHDEVKLVEGRLSGGTEDKAFARAEATLKEQHDRNIERERSLTAAAQDALREAERIVGSRLRWSNEMDDLRAAVALVKSGGIESATKKLRELRDKLTAIIEPPPILSEAESALAAAEVG